MRQKTSDAHNMLTPLNAGSEALDIKRSVPTVECYFLSLKVISRQPEKTQGLRQELCYSVLNADT